MEKSQRQIHKIGPHTAHLLFKIVIVLLVAGFYTITNFFGLVTALSISIGIYLAVPFCLYFSSRLTKNLIFLHNVWWPPTGPIYFRTTYHGLQGGRNFYLDSNTYKEAEVGIGVWHILPSSLLPAAASNKTKQFFIESLQNSGRPIIIYFHGNMGSRATGHRVELYKLMQSTFDAHVIVFDYYGFADSQPFITPNETSSVNSSFVVYKWLADQILGNGQGVQDQKVYVWGHSLGTSISTHLLSKLADANSNLRKASRHHLKIHGLVLEAPFTTMAEQFQFFPLNQIYTFWPIFDYLFILPLFKNDTAFETDFYLRSLHDLPVLVLHSPADVVVPYSLGDKLYRRIKALRASVEAAAADSLDEDDDSTSSTTTISPIVFEQLDGLPTNLAHTYLYICPKFTRVVNEFISKC